jgi:hypothetical protein
MSKSVGQAAKDYCATIKGKIDKYEKEGNEERVKHWKLEYSKHCKKTKAKEAFDPVRYTADRDKLGDGPGPSYAQVKANQAKASQKKGGSRRKRTMKSRKTRRA